MKTESKLEFIPRSSRRPLISNSRGDAIPAVGIGRPDGWTRKYDRFDRRVCVLEGSGFLSDQKPKQLHVIFSFGFVLEEENLHHSLPQLDDKPEFFLLSIG